jgi:hypothetical protein
MYAMSPSILKPLAVAGLACAIAGASTASLAADPVRAGFERMLAPQAAPHIGAPATPREPADPLVEAIVAPVREGIGHPAAVRAAIAGESTDAVARSFARMLDHEPARFTPARPDSADADPLIAAIVWPLLRAQHLSFASAAPLVVLR